MIVLPHTLDAIVEIGDTSDTPVMVASLEMRGWMEAVTALLNALDIAEGAGSPEGVLEAEQKKLYFNTSGGAGTWIYIKTTTSGNTGWVAIG